MAGETRIDRDSIIKQIKDLEDTIRELKTGNQFVEAKMYETVSANTSGYSGSLPGSIAAAGTTLAIIVVTLTATDGVTPFLSYVVPQIGIPDMTSIYEDQSVGNTYIVSSGIVVSSSQTVVQHWFQLATRGGFVSATTVAFKYYAYSTTPVTASVSRAV